MSVRSGGSAASHSASVAPAEAPKSQCESLPEVDWNALWLVSCNRLSGCGPPRTSETKAKFIDLGLAESSIAR